jgi:2-iminobutanoate/2-iminopropanoate deaminase
MNRTIINPWTWQEPLGFVHGNKISNPNSTLFMAGQTASNENGRTLFAGDMESQITQVLKNIEKVLEQAEMDFTHIVRLNVYTVNMELMMKSHDHMAKILREKGCLHVGTLLGIHSLAAPDALIEMEVTAAS